MPQDATVETSFQARALGTALSADVRDMSNDIHSMVFMRRWADYVLGSVNALLAGPHTE